jgi:hypothetical protein
VYAIRFRRFRLLLLGALGASRRGLRGRQPNGGQNSTRGANVLAAGNGEIAQKLTRRHRLNGAAPVAGHAALGGEGERALRTRWLGGSR